ncbi:MAG: hypothetical protein LC749_19115, partial [Actinobacteria bacterium]|nr:hypothetical protein [Actinomycetota bacterium]
VSEAFRMVARRMADADQGDRDSVWNMFLSLMDPADADALVEGAANPDFSPGNGIGLPCVS